MMSDNQSDSDVEENLPSQEVCEERCQKFADVTGTDTALAMFYLQDREWDLERALNAYFADSGASPSSSTQSVGQVTKKVDSEAQVAVKSDAKEADPEPHRIRLLSWNIDGLDSGNYKSRTDAVCEKINKEKPHIVFLQEVIPETVTMLEDKCTMYSVIPGGEHDYFTAIMLRVGHIEFEDSVVQPFYSSKMLRNLLAVKCIVKGVKMDLITSHLESTKSHDVERKGQLRIAFEKMKKADADRTVIFGGDLNLRDKELVEVGGIPEDIFDLWEVTGKRPEAKFTWDTQRNDNVDMGGKFKPRCRFDRLYLRHPKPASRIKPVYFELVGLERLPCLRFPSDHWGLLTHFDINGVGRPN